MGKRVPSSTSRRLNAWKGVTYIGKPCSCAGCLFGSTCREPIPLAGRPIRRRPCRLSLAFRARTAMRSGVGRHSPGSEQCVFPSDGRVSAPKNDSPCGFYLTFACPGLRQGRCSERSRISYFTEQFPPRQTDLRHSEFLELLSPDSGDDSEDRPGIEKSSERSSAVNIALRIYKEWPGRSSAVASSGELVKHSLCAIWIHFEDRSTPPAS